MGEGLYDSLTDGDFGENLRATNCGAEGISLSGSSSANYNGIYSINNGIEYTRHSQGIFKGGVAIETYRSTVSNIFSFNSAAVGIVVRSDPGTSDVAENTFSGWHTYGSKNIGILVGWTDPNTFTTNNNVYDLNSENDGKIDGSAIYFIGSDHNNIYGLSAIGNGNGGSGNALLALYDCRNTFVSGVNLDGWSTTPYFAYKIHEFESLGNVTIIGGDISRSNFGSAVYSITSNTTVAYVIGYQ